MSVKEIKVPDIGDFAHVDVIEVHIQPGQFIQANDPVITLENDKASLDLPALFSGVVQEVKVKVGDKVSEGDLIYTMAVSEDAAAAEVETERATTATAPAAAKAASSSPQQPPPSAPKLAPAPAASALRSTDVPSFEGVHASPRIRRLARELGIDLNLVRGTGRKGRITREDLGAFLSGETSALKEPVQEPATSKETVATAAAPTAGGTGIPSIPVVDFSKFGPTETLPLGRIKRLTAAAMSRSWLNIPHVTHNDEADVTELEAFRKSLKAEAEQRGVRISILSFVLKAVVATLKQFPTFNASLDPSGEALILKRYYHIGIAVDTPNGLVVPVIRDVDQKSIFELSEELAEISQKARAQKLGLSDIQGGTFTISSLGGIGGTTFTPIINAPEVAILGMTRSKMQPVWDGQGFVPRLIQPLSLSYDHRVIDGAEAARFCRALATYLGDIRRLLL